MSASRPPKPGACGECGADAVWSGAEHAYICAENVNHYVTGARSVNGAVGPGSAALKFVSAAELRAATPVEPNWLWAGYLAPGAVTMLAGKPKSGKSTLACAVIEAVATEGGTFLGRAISAGPVVYVAEEAAGTLAHKLPATDRVRVLTRDAAWPRPAWPALVAAAVAESTRIGAVLLVIDALAFWAGFTEGQEKDAGAAQSAMGALTAATRAGLAVVLVHHQRKAGGEDGDAVRGSSAIFGAIDLLIELEKVEDAATPGQRRLVAVGRWTSTPGVLVVEREPEVGAWRALGDATSRADVGVMALRERVLAAVPPEWPGAVEPEIVELAGGSKQRAGETLRELLGEGMVERVGKGAKGDPYHYRKAPPKCSPGLGGESAEPPSERFLPFSPRPIGGRKRKQL
jgi:AAA domain